MAKENREDAALDRNDFFERNQDELIQLMNQSGITDPVGVLLDVRDHHGRQFAIAIGQTDAEVDAFIAKHAGKTIPTIKSVITWEHARLLMPYTSPTALKTLSECSSVCKSTGQCLAIIIAGKGNAYR